MRTCERCSRTRNPRRPLSPNKVSWSAVCRGPDNKQGRSPGGPRDGGSGIAEGDLKLGMVVQLFLIIGEVVEEREDILETVELN